MGNNRIGFSWEQEYHDDVVCDYNSLSPEIEKYPITVEEMARIAYYDAMARDLLDGVDDKQYAKSASQMKKAKKRHQREYEQRHVDRSDPGSFIGRCLKMIVGIFVVVVIVGLVIGL